MHFVLRDISEIYTQQQFNYKKAKKKKIYSSTTKKKKVCRSVFDV